MCGDGVDECEEDDKSATFMSCMGDMSRAGDTRGGGISGATADIRAEQPYYSTLFMMNELLCFS